MGRSLARMHGNRVLWIGPNLAAAAALNNKMIKSVVYLVDEKPVEQMPAFTAHTHQLPFESNSLDGVVLHHSLEESQDPRLVLREVSRVLAPGGRLVVCGFNPWSLLGLRRMYAKFVPDVMSRPRLTNPIRLFDWLTLLGLELDAPPSYGGLGLFWNRDATEAVQVQQVPFSGVFVTSAVKQVSQYRFSGKLRPRLATVAYPRIATWQERTSPLDGDSA